MKKYNPLTLNIDIDEPNWETELCKWWLCEISENKKFGLFLTLNKRNGEKNYVILNNELHKIIFYSQVLEQALMHLTMCEKADEFPDL